MKVDAVTFDKVFLKSVTLKIPFFQRGYVWGESNWKKFFDDLSEIARDLQEGLSPKDYFIGSIILKTQNNNQGPQVEDVIDGQQRLTTIVLFMKALCLAMNKNIIFKEMFYQTRQDLTNEPDPILLPNYNDKAVYNSILDLEILKREPIVANNKMAEAFAYFAKRIVDAHNATDDTALSLDQLYRAFAYCVRVVVIEVSAQEDAQKIFETINCTGIKLTTGEMLKNYLFDENSVPEYEKSWKPVFESNHQNYWEGSVTKGRQSDSHIENFFYHYMLLLMLSPQVKGKLTPSELRSFRKNTGLYEKFCKLMQKCNISKEAEINDIVSYAKLYINTFKSTTLDEVAPSYGGVERLAHLMYMSNAWTMVPYILYILRTVSSENERSRIFQYMEVYLLRRMICKSRNNNYSDLFSENLIGQQVCTFEAFSDYVNDQEKRGALLMPSDEDVYNAVRTKDLKSEAGIVLYMLETKLDSSFAESSRNNSYNALSKEQIMPEKENANWKFDPVYVIDGKSTLPKTLGNFVLLREKFSAKLKPAAWTDKRQTIKELGTDLKTSQFYKVAQWTEKEILARNEWLASKIVEAWPI